MYSLRILILWIAGHYNFLRHRLVLLLIFLILAERFEHLIGPANTSERLLEEFDVKPALVVEKLILHFLFFHPSVGFTMVGYDSSHRVLQSFGGLIDSEEFDTDAFSVGEELFAQE